MTTSLLALAEALEDAEQDVSFVSATTVSSTDGGTVVKLVLCEKKKHVPAEASALHVFDAVRKAVDRAVGIVPLPSIKVNVAPMEMGKCVYDITISTAPGVIGRASHIDAASAFAIAYLGALHRRTGRI